MNFALSSAHIASVHKGTMRLVWSNSLKGIANDLHWAVVVAIAHKGVCHAISSVLETDFDCLLIA